MATAIGIDLCGDDTTVHISGSEEAFTLPTVICRERETERFSVGEEAYRRTLDGEGVLVDKLLRLAERGGTATIGGTCYKAQELLNLFLREAVSRVLPEGSDVSEIGALTVSVTAPKGGAREAALTAARSLGLPADRIRVIGHTEAMMYYILSGEQAFYHNTAALYHLTEEGLFYYEMQLLRGVRRVSAAGDGMALDEGFNLDILKTEAGRKLGDSILVSCAGKLMARKNYSAVFLTGKGFADMDCFPQFRSFLCRRRRVLSETGLFARGASAASADRLRGKTAYPYVFLCESRLPADISISVMNRKREEQLLLAEAGQPWEESTAQAELLPCRQDYIDIDITPANRTEQKRTVRVPLRGFPKRPDRCTKIALSVSFPQAGTLRLCVKDRGLGEIFPASDACVYEEIEI